MTKESFTSRFLLNRSLHLRILILLMLIAASIWLGYQFHRLVRDPGPTGAIDLKQRYEDLHCWFHGFPVYGEIKTASYPPASQIMLWPFLGWLPLPQARWLWAITSTASLAWIAIILQRESQAVSRLDKVFVLLIPFASYAAGATIGNGQLLLHVLPPLIVSLLLMQKKSYSWKTEIAAALLFLFALVKPSITAPFFWIVLFAPGRLRTALIIVAGYSGLSLWSGSFQNQDQLSLLLAWLENSQRILAEIAPRFSNSNLHSWFLYWRIETWTVPVSIISLLILGLWIRRNRQADPWLLISVTAIFARLWTYHAWYDDLLIAPAVIALFNLSRNRNLSGRWQQGLELYLCLQVLFMLAPGGKYLLSPSWSRPYLVVQAVAWASLLILLVWFVHKKTFLWNPNRTSR